MHLVYFVVLNIDFLHIVLKSDKSRIIRGLAKSLPSFHSVARLVLDYNVYSMPDIDPSVVAWAVYNVSLQLATITRADVSS